MAITSEDDGWINLRYVVRVKDAYPDELGRARSVLHLTDGKTVSVLEDSDDIAPLLDPVIPAQPGFEYLTAWRDGDDEKGPHVVADREPVIGWRLAGRQAMPITVSGIDCFHNGRGAVLYPSGKVYMPGENSDFEDIDSWLRQLDAWFEPRKVAATAR